MFFPFHLPESTKYNILKNINEYVYVYMSQWNIYKWLEEFKGKWKTVQDKEIPGWSGTEVIDQDKHGFWDKEIIRF